MARIEIQKTMFADGKEAHVSGRAPVTDAAHLTGGEMKALAEKLGWRTEEQLHVIDAEGNLALESKLDFF